MKRWIMLAVVLFVPVVASAQYKDLDSAMSSLTRGFGSGDAGAVVAGIGDGDQVVLQFPGMVSQSGPFGRDQASYFLEGLFNKFHPSGFELLSARKVSAEGQYHITANWTVQDNGKPVVRDLYLTLRNKNDRWSLVSARTSGR